MQFAGHDITPEWITPFIASHLEEGTRITAVDCRNIGEGEGFAGTVIRAQLQYDRPTSAPESLVIKLPTEDPEVRRALVQRDIFLREARFYTRLAPGLAVRTPAIFHAEIDEASQDYVLVMEDLGALAADEPGYRTVAEVESFLSALALLHAQYWNDAAVKSDWLKPVTDTDDRTEDMERLERGVNVIESFPGDVAYLLACARLVQKHFPRAPSRFPLLKPYTLTHGDFHANNVALTDSGVVVYDWQLVSGGAPASDVTNMLITSLSPEDLMIHQEALYRHYHAELLKAGVRRFSYAKFRKTCDDALTINIIKFIVILGTVDFGDEKGLEVRDRAIDTLCMIANQTDALKRFKQLPRMFLILRLLNLFIK